MVSVNFEQLIHLSCCVGPSPVLAVRHCSNLNVASFFKHLGGHFKLIKFDADFRHFPNDVISLDRNTRISIRKRFVLFVDNRYLHQSLVLPVRQ